MPVGLTIDATGNMYFTEGNRVRKVSTSGLITTIAGINTDHYNTGYSGDGGPATDAKLATPWGVAIDGAGNVYVADHDNYCIRKITPSGIISTFAGVAGYAPATDRGDGGPATAAKFKSVAYIKFDHSGNLLIPDGADGRVRKVSPSGIISTFIELANPFGIAIDGHDNIYVSTESTIVKATPSGAMTTIAGNNGNHSLSTYDPGDGGPATAATIQATGLYIDPSDNIYFCTYLSDRIRKINTEGYVSTFAGGIYNANIGDNGDIAYCSISPLDIAVDAGGNMMVSDTRNNRIRKISNVLAVKNIMDNREDITVYPTYNRGSFTVDLTTLTATQASIAIMDMTGKKIHELNTATNKPVQLNLQVSAGTYFVVATTLTGKYCSKVIVE